MIIFYLKEAFKTFSRSKLSTVLTIFSLAISILLIAISITLLIFSNNFISSIKSKIELTAFAKGSIVESEVNSKINEIKKLKGVSRVIFVPKSEALEEFILETGEDFRVILDENPLPDIFKIYFSPDVNLNRIESIRRQLKNYAYIDEVIFDNAVILSIFELLNSAKLVIYVFSVLFCFISVYLVFAHSKLYILQRIVHFNTMKLVGAKVSTIKIPLMLSGIIMGTLAALINVILITVIFVTIGYFYKEFQFVRILYFLNFVLLILGVILGPIGSGLFAKRISLKINQ
ncbi:MAG: permease-like cell division protein FtsX [Bacteroidetes bacterium]|nr:permease-like cell division protein FtsX [Bacteroidota bacterium]